MKSFSITDVRLLRAITMIVMLLLWLGSVYQVEGAPPEPTIQPTATPYEPGFDRELNTQLFLSSSLRPNVNLVQDTTPITTQDSIQLMATSGHWTGTTNQARPMSFDVLSNGNQWDNFRVQVTFSSCNVLLTYTLFGPGSISNNQFSGVSIDGEFSFSGQFTSANTASGTFNFFNISIPGCGTRSQSGIWTASIPVTILAPSNLTALPLSKTQILLTWQDNSNNETGFRIERSPNGITGWSQIAIVGTNVTTYSNLGVACDTPYFYRVQAYNGSGNSAYSNIAEAATDCGDNPLGHKVYLPLILKSPLPPPDGHWTGTTSRSQPMSFDVSGGGITLQNFKLKTTFSNGSCSGTLEITVGGAKTISNNQFSHNGGTFSFSGQLTSLTTANGIYSFVNHSTGCGLLTQSGTWSAQLP